MEKKVRARMRRKKREKVGGRKGKCNKTKSKKEKNEGGAREK